MTEKPVRHIRVAADDSPGSLRAALNRSNPWRVEPANYEERLRTAGLVENDDGTWSLPG